MTTEAMSHTCTRMTALERQGTFKRWVSIDDPWQPDLTLLQQFGSLPNRDGRFDRSSKLVVRCSPQLYAFILGHTRYKQPAMGPDPHSAFTFLLRQCFVNQHSMFVGACSPYQLICRSQMILDMAFVLAVQTASAWLGPVGMPTGYILTWPPPGGE